MERTKSSNLGSILPSFALPNVDGSVVTDCDLKGGKLSLVVFICNHCPYVIGSEKMLMDTIREYMPLGVKCVLISSNDPAQYEEDSFENMKIKAQADRFPCPYLYDESQNVARAFDAQCTPECFLYGNDQLIFHGTVNNNPRNPGQASETFLKTAIDQALSGQAPNPSFVHPIGCSIKWKTI